VTSSGAPSELNRSLANTDFKKSNKSNKPEKTKRYELLNGLVIVLAIINPKLLEVDDTLGVYIFN
jgi:hypothetical protein